MSENKNKSNKSKILKKIKKMFSRKRKNENTQQVNIEKDFPQNQVESSPNQPVGKNKADHINGDTEGHGTKRLKKDIGKEDIGKRDIGKKDSGYEKGSLEIEREDSGSKSQDESVRQKILELEQSKLELEQSRLELEQELAQVKQKLEMEQEFKQQLKNDLIEEKNHSAELAEENKILKNSNEVHEENANNINSLQKKFEEKEAELKEKEDEFSKLEEKNAELRKEASKYQSALGNATNIRLGDEDSVKFREDIISLQKTLENYVTNLKPNMDVDFEKVQVLAQKYGCSTPVDKGHKPFIKALLQRKALDDILELSKDSVNKGEDVKLEMNIENKTQELLGLIENFSASRSGTDETAKVASIKVRQQVYGILGNRGFADVTDSNGNHVHDFITYVSDNLNNTMNQYRKINDSDKKRDVESIAPKLIQDIYKLFFYLLNVQEPRVEYKFCEAGSKIETNVMKGNWDEDDVPQLCVDICSFPMIGRDLNSPNWKIYTHAKVYPYDPSKTS